MKYNVETLQPEDASKLRCGMMLDNRMQCSNRASFNVDGTLMCKHHFQLAQALGNVDGNTYQLTNEPVVVSTQGKRIEKNENNI